MLEKCSQKLRLAGIEGDHTVDKYRDHVDECGTPLAPTSGITNAGVILKNNGYGQVAVAVAASLESSCVFVLLFLDVRWTENPSLCWCSDAVNRYTGLPLSPLLSSKRPLKIYASCFAALLSFKYFGAGLFQR